MEERTVVYSKLSGEPIVPVTVRIEWLPDGKVKPRMFWMPDGSCYQVRDVYEMTHLAVLKDRGEGLRFKVKAETAETPGAYTGDQYVSDQYVGDRYVADNGDRYAGDRYVSDNGDQYAGDQYARLEVYLYLADNLFCGRNIIDSRYSHMNKEFIHVTLDVFPNCDYEPVYFIARGLRYKVEKLIDKEPRGSYDAGGVGVWHKVEARVVNAHDDEDPEPGKSVRRMAALYFEVNKWFVVVDPTR